MNSLCSWQLPKCKAAGAVLNRRAYRLLLSCHRWPRWLAYQSQMNKIPWMHPQTRRPSRNGYRDSDIGSPLLIFFCGPLRGSPSMLAQLSSELPKTSKINYPTCHLFVSGPSALSRPHLEESSIPRCPLDSLHQIWLDRLPDSNVGDTGTFS